MRTISWRMIFDEFKKTYPSMSKNVSNWYPTGHLEITVKLNDGTKLIFDYLTKKSQVIPCERAVVERKRIMDEYEWREEFSARLFDILEEVGMTQKELAEEIGVDERTIRMYKHGDRTPNAYIVHKMAMALGCNPSELVDFD